MQNSNHFLDRDLGNRRGNVGRPERRNTLFPSDNIEVPGRDQELPEPIHLPNGIADLLLGPRDQPTIPVLVQSLQNHAGRGGYALANVMFDPGRELRSGCGGGSRSLGRDNGGYGNRIHGVLVSSNWGRADKLAGELNRSRLRLGRGRNENAHR